MKDEDWVEAIEDSVETYRLSVRQRFQALNYMALDDETLDRLRNESRREWERRQKERFDNIKTDQNTDMYMDYLMDYSETEEEDLEKYLRKKEIDRGYISSYEDLPDHE